MIIGICEEKPVNSLDFDLETFTNTKLYKVVRSRRINSGGSKYAIVEFVDGEIQEPDSEFISISVLAKENYKTYVIWEDKVWTLLTDDALLVICTMTGVLKEDLVKTAEFINDSAIPNK